VPANSDNPKPDRVNDIVEVAAGLVFRDGKLLITQRYPDAHLGGMWEFPGGKRHEGETFEECLRRELREELGIEVNVREMIEEIRHDYPEKSVHLKFYRCDCDTIEPQILGCNALVWVDVADLDKYCFPAADAQLLQKLRENKALWISVL
jgi:mutator protein MutT